jgi:hypothetical protein
VATLGILHERILTRSELVNQQLQAALNTRLIVEQPRVLCSRNVVASTWSLDPFSRSPFLRRIQLNVGMPVTSWSARRYAD